MDKQKQEQKLNNEPGNVFDLPSTALAALGKMKNEYPAQGPEDLFGFIGRPMLYTFATTRIQATLLNNKRKRGKKSVKKDFDKNSVESDLNNVD